MVPTTKAIIIAANPFVERIVAPNRTTKVLGNVDFHWEHLRRNGGVFWDIVPMGRRDLPWKHPDIHSGTFIFQGFKRLSIGLTSST